MAHPIFRPARPRFGRSKKITRGPVTDATAPGKLQSHLLAGRTKPVSSCRFLIEIGCQEPASSSTKRGYIPIVFLPSGADGITLQSGDTDASAVRPLVVFRPARGLHLSCRWSVSHFPSFMRHLSAYTPPPRKRGAIMPRPSLSDGGAMLAISVGQQTELFRGRFLLGLRQ